MTTEPQRVRFVERMGATLTTAGMARLPSRIFAAVLIDEDGRMTAAELAAQLEVSAAAISGAVKYLDGVGMVRRERERGSRRDIFVVDDDAWHAVMTQADQVYAPILATLDRVLDEIDRDDPARRRLRLSREFMTFIVEEMKVIDQRWTERRKELGLDE